MKTSLPDDPQFNKYYEKHGKYLRLKGLQPKISIKKKSRAIRCVTVMQLNFIVSILSFQ